MPSFFVANDEFLFFLLFHFLYMYHSTASLGKIGSLTMSISLLIKWMKLVKPGSLLCLLCIVKAFLNHLSLALPGNLTVKCTQCQVYSTHSSSGNGQYSSLWLHQEVLESLIWISIASFDLSLCLISFYRVIISLSKQLFCSFKSSLSWQQNAIFCNFLSITCCILNQSCQFSSRIFGFPLKISVSISGAD